MALVSLDLETTGLDERCHEAWEIAYVTEGGDEFCYQFPLRRPHLADPKALEIGGFNERYWSGAFIAGKAYDSIQEGPVTPRVAAAVIQKALRGATLMGCAVQFDMRFLAELLRSYGREPEWHHRVLDLGSFAAGCLGETQPCA